MSWKGLKKVWEERLCERLQGRLEVHCTGYHRAYDQRGKVWFTLDGQIVYTACEFRDGNAYRKEMCRLLEKPLWAPMIDIYCDRRWQATSIIAGKNLSESGLILPSSLVRGIFVILQTSIDAALAESDPCIRGLAYVDRRCGKRRLIARVEHDPHPLADLLLQIRRKAEGLPSEDDGG